MNKLEIRVNICMHIVYRFLCLKALIGLKAIMLIELGDVKAS